MVSLPPDSFPLVYLLVHISCESRVIHSYIAIQQVFIKHSLYAKYFSKHWDTVANREKPHGSDIIMGETNKYFESHTFFSHIFPLNPRLSLL